MIAFMVGATSTIGNAPTFVASCDAALVSEERPDTTAVFSLLQTHISVHAATAIFTIWQESLVGVLLHVCEHLEYGVLGNSFHVVHDCVQLVKINVFALVQDSLTSMHMFHSRRIGAERILNKSKNIDFNQLYAVMNNVETIAKDTIFQMFANVQKDTYKTFLPDCEDCSGCVDGDVCLKKGEDCCGVRSFFTHKCGVTGGYKCGCVPDGTCRAHHKGDHGNSSHGDMDCCSFQSHATLKCPFGRMCGAKPSNSIEFV
jgi:hypothetical protein